MLNSFESDLQLKMARNHLNGFTEMVEEDFLQKYEIVREYTMCSMERLYDLFLSINYLDEAKIPGSIVEVGVWAGGALGLAALSGNSRTCSRKYVGFDTFSGHLEPSPTETDLWGNNQADRWKTETNEGEREWAGVSLEEVSANLERMGVSMSDFELVSGDVRQTLPSWETTHEIALARIDVDWYPETRLSLEQLWPRIASGGILILDDFGHYPGARRAVLEFFSDSPVKRTHVDYSCVSIVKS